MPDHRSSTSSDTAHQSGDVESSGPAGNGGADPCRLAPFLSALAEPGTLTVLREIGERERTLAGIASHIDEPVDVVAAWIGRLVRTGLVEPRDPAAPLEHHEYRLTRGARELLLDRSAWTR